MSDIVDYNNSKEEGQFLSAEFKGQPVSRSPRKITSFAENHAAG
jgi:hypothetical protein